MSINACSINEFTINSLCSSRRKVIIDNIRPIVVPSIGGGSVQHVRPDTAAWLNVIRRQRSDDVFDENVESSHIQVTVEVAGTTYSQTLERTTVDDLALIIVSSLSASNQDREQVNISDVKITRVHHDI